MDEVYIGGEAQVDESGRPRAAHTGRGTVDKTPVFGMAQRGTSKKAKDGANRGIRLPDSTAEDPSATCQTEGVPKAVVYTDNGSPTIRSARMGYTHDAIRHSAKVYVSGDVHTNTIEGFWSLLQRGISGVYHGVSTKHLQSYLDEYTFRYNNRDAAGWGVFSAMLDRIRKASVRARRSLPLEPAPGQRSHRPRAR